MWCQNQRQQENKNLELHQIANWLQLPSCWAFKSCCFKVERKKEERKRNLMLMIGLLLDGGEEKSVTVQKSVLCGTGQLVKQCQFRTVSFETFVPLVVCLIARILSSHMKIQIIAGGLSTVIQAQKMSMGFPFCNYLDNFHAPIWNLFLFFPPNLKRLFLLPCNWLPLTVIYEQAEIMTLKVVLLSIEAKF